MSQAIKSKPPITVISAHIQHGQYSAVRQLHNEEQSQGFASVSCNDNRITGRQRRGHTHASSPNLSYTQMVYEFPTSTDGVTYA